LAKYRIIKIKKRKNIIHLDMNSKEIIIPKNKDHAFHAHEGITKELIIKILRNHTKFIPSPARFTYSRMSNNYYVTEVVQRIPCIRVTVLFRLVPKDKVIVTNSYLGGIHSKNMFEKEWKKYWNKEC